MCLLIYLENGPSIKIDDKNENLNAAYKNSFDTYALGS